MNKTERRILYFLTRTPLHVGAGSSVGAIDQPVQRERHTGFPIIPGSSIKGVLRDLCGRGPLANRQDAIFGTQANAGRLAFSDAKVIAFPVRSAKGSFAFITCPLALERIRRDNPALKSLSPVPVVADMACLAGDNVVLGSSTQTGVVLEEYRFNRRGAFPADWEQALISLINDPVWQAGKGRLVLLSDGDFGHFVTTACEVAQHVGIDPETGTARSGALFNLEAVPAETLFYSPILPLAREGGELDELAAVLASQPVAQFGGDSTTGLGFCSIAIK